MKMNMNRFSKLKMPKAGKRPMMMAITGIVIVFLFYFFFMRGSSSMSEGFREGVNSQTKQREKAVAVGQETGVRPAGKVAGEMYDRKVAKAAAATK